MSIFIDENTLKEKLNNKKEKFFVIDVRADQALYEEGHIPRAIYINPSKYISGTNRFFVEPTILGGKLGSVGIDEQSELIIYDGGNNRNAAKSWVALYYIGHENLKILQGGFSAWENSENPITKEKQDYQATAYSVSPKEHVVKSLEDIRQSVTDDTKTLIDSRSHDRYIGKKEPKYAKAGHIPSAVNFSAKDVMNEKGQWKNKHHLQEHFARLEGHDDITVSCGTGGSACLNMIALIEAGFSNVSIFPGGFKEWIDANEPIATEDE